mgnify:CR=1 FL=1
MRFDELQKLAKDGYGDMVKGVADIKRKVIALGGELHADAEALLINDGSASRDLWGFNIYPAKAKDERIEFTSLINIRPALGNKSMEVKDPKIQSQMQSIINNLIEEK